MAFVTPVTHVLQAQSQTKGAFKVGAKVPFAFAPRTHRIIFPSASLSPSPVTNVKMNASSESDQQPKAHPLAALTMFVAYFGALISVVRRAAMEATLPHERIILMGIAVILPDLARFSFTGMALSASSLKLATGQDTNAPGDVVSKHSGLCTLTTLVKLAGYYLAAYSKITVGAFVVVFGQFLVNWFIQLRFVKGTMFQLKRQDRSGVLFLEVLSLGLLAASYFGVYPIMSAAFFLSLVTVYWLAKYDIQFFGTA